MVFNANYNNILVINIIMAVCFIDGGNWSTQRKPLTSRKSRPDFTKPTKKRKSASWSIEYTIKKEL